MKNVVLGVLAGACAFLGGLFGIGWGWVGGIEEIVRGATANTVSAHDIAWGAIRALVLGDVIVVAGIASCMALLTVMLGRNLFR